METIDLISTSSYSTDSLDLKLPIIGSTSIDIQTSTFSTSSFDLTTTTEISDNELIVEDPGEGISMLAGYNPAMDYDFISALLLLGIFILSLFDFLRRHSSKL